MQGIDNSRPVLEEANENSLINVVGVFSAVFGGPFLNGEWYVHAGLQPVKTIHPNLNSVTGCKFDSIVRKVANSDYMYRIGTGCFQGMCGGIQFFYRALAVGQCEWWPIFVAVARFYCKEGCVALGRVGC